MTLSRFVRRLYWAIPLTIVVILLLLMLTIYFAFSSPFSLFWVFGVPFIAAVFTGLGSVIIYFYDSPGGLFRDLKGLSKLTNEYAQRELMKKARDQFETNFTLIHDMPKIMALKVGETDTDILTIYAKEDIVPTTKYLAAAISKEDPDMICFELIYGSISLSERDNLLKNLAESLAAKSNKNQTEIVRNIDPITGRETIHTIRYPARITSYAKRQIEEAL